MRGTSGMPCCGKYFLFVSTRVVMFPETGRPWIPMMEILLPCWGRSLKRDNIAQVKSMRWFTGFSDQSHARLSQGTRPFFSVALNAAGYDVFPAFLTSHPLRDYMIKRQAVLGITTAAILAPKSVSNKNIDAGKFNNRSPMKEKSYKADHGRKPQCQVHTSDLPGIFFENLHLAQNKQSNGFLPWYDP